MKKFFPQSIITSDIRKADVVLFSPSINLLNIILAKEIENKDDYQYLAVTNVDEMYNTYTLYTYSYNEEYVTGNTYIYKNALKSQIGNVSIYGDLMSLGYQDNKVKLQADFLIDFVLEAKTFNNNLKKDFRVLHSESALKEMLLTRINTLGQRRNYLHKNRKYAGDPWYDAARETHREYQIGYCDKLDNIYNYDFSKIYDIYSNFNMYVDALNISNKVYTTTDLLNKTVVYLNETDLAMIDYNFRDKELPMTIEEAIIAYDDLGTRTATKIMSKWDECELTIEDYVRAVMYHKNIVPELDSLRGLRYVGHAKRSITPDLNEGYHSNISIVATYIEKLKQLINHIKT